MLEYGVIKNPTFTDYLLPTFLDAPPIEIEVIGNPVPSVPSAPREWGAPHRVLNGSGGGRHPRRHRPVTQPHPGKAGARGARSSIDELPGVPLVNRIRLLKVT